MSATVSDESRTPALLAEASDTDPMPYQQGEKDCVMEKEGRGGGGQYEDRDDRRR